VKCGLASGEVFSAGPEDLPVFSPMPLRLTARFRLLNSQKASDQSHHNPLFTGAAPQRTASAEKNAANPPARAKNFADAKPAFTAANKKPGRRRLYYAANLANKDLLFSSELVELKNQLSDSRIATNSPAKQKNSATPVCPKN